MMRHYEIVLLIHPDQGEQLMQMIDRYVKTIETSGGKVHRLENCGRKNLAYEINKLQKAYYAVLNIEVDDKTLNALTHAFKFNEAIVRYLVVSKTEAVTEESALMRNEEEEAQQEESTYERRDRNHHADAPHEPDITEQAQAATTMEQTESQSTPAEVV